MHDWLVVEVTPSGGYHVIYRCEVPVSGNLKLAQRKVDDKVITLIETRGEGGLFLCAPTMGYILGHGDLANLPVLTEAERDALLQAAWELNEYLPPAVNGPQTSTMSADLGRTSASSAENGRMSSDMPRRGDCPSNNWLIGQGMAMSVGPCGSPPENADRPGDDFNTRGDVREVLAQHGWVRIKGGENEYWRRPGKESGMSATLKDGVFYVFSSNAAPFEPFRGYSPFAVYTLLNHGGDFEQAARSLRLSGYGGDPGNSLPENAPHVDISAIVGQIGDCPADHADVLPDETEISDPGPMPLEMLRIPGFISEVMDHTLTVAAYPNPVMAFAGALALQAVLAGRKVRDPGDNRTNIYLLGLALSSAGKDQSRKVNNDVLHAVGMADSLGLSFASGEGLQDALFQTPSMLFQTDEIDGMLQSINKSKDARHEAIMGTMLTMYSSANSVFPMRRKAGTPGPGKSPGVIDQPCLVIYGTAIPNHYYGALSERMLTNGFLARMIIVESGPRPKGQEPSIPGLPPRVLATARWWADYRPGTGNLEGFHPVPTVVEHSEEAKRLLVETREEAEAEYTAAESKSDPVGTTVWGRVSEQTRKLALLYAVSENHQSPRIGLAAVKWASAFMMHQTRRMLFMAAGHVAENPFHAECLKLLRKLRESPGGQMARNKLMRAMRCKLADFDQIVGTLLTQGDIVPVDIRTKTKTAQGYRLP